jgi:hypothetical protein
MAADAAEQTAILRDGRLRGGLLRMRACVFEIL